MSLLGLMTSSASEREAIRTCFSFLHPKGRSEFIIRPQAQLHSGPQPDGSLCSTCSLDPGTTPSIIECQGVPLRVPAIFSICPLSGAGDLGV